MRTYPEKQFSSNRVPFACFPLFGVGTSSIQAAKNARVLKSNIQHSNPSSLGDLAVRNSSPRFPGLPVAQRIGMLTVVGESD
jgi:hypothetical protein